MQVTAVRISRYVPLLLLCAALCVVSSAQTTGGRILGRVTDPTGAAVAKANVKLTNEATETSRTAETDQTGDYTFIEVPVGSYRLEFDAAGFQKNLRRGVTLQVNQVLTINVGLKVGSAHDVIEVTGEAPLVDTSSTQLGAVVTDHSVSNLPLTARDTYQLLQLQPGVQGVGGSDLFYGSNMAGAVSVNGGRGRANNFSVNGGDANDLFVNAPAVQPSPDSIQEFRVLTNTFDAEYGRNSGAVVNVVTKSGTNRFHGNVYEFLRNRSLNSKGFLDPFTPDNKTNQFGGTFGGPIRKDRTFFFTSYEGRRAINGVTSDPVFVPTAAERNGDFSASPFDPTATLTDDTLAQVLNARPGCAQAISSAGGSSPAAGTPWLSIFPNSQIPTQCLDPVAVNLLRFVPAPNNPNTIYGALGNVVQTIPNARTQTDQFTARIDHHLSATQTLNIYYYLFDSRDAQPFTRFEALTPNLLEGFGNVSKTRSQQVNISHTWALSNTTVNEFRFTYFRNAQGTFLHPQHTNLVTDSCTGAAAQFCFTGVTDVPGVIGNGDPVADRKLGITPGLGAAKEGVPFISLSTGFTIGNDFEGELPQIGNTFQWSNNLTKVKGRHTLKFGGDVRRARFDQTLVFDPNGDFSFFGGGSNDFIATNADGTQNLFPNFLMGLPDSYLQGSANSENIRSTSLYLFGQDSWKIKPNLTLNYGLRWEMNTPLGDKSQRVQTFRPGQPTTIFPCQLSSANQAALGATTPDCGLSSPDPAASSIFPTGLVIPGDPGVPNGLTQTYTHAFAPRIGLAWSPDWDNKLTGGPGRTSIRMGFGVFYNPIEQLVLEQFQAEPPFGISTSVSESYLSTPFATQSCTTPCVVGGQGVAPNGANGILNPTRGQPVDWSVFRPLLLFGELQPNIRPQYAEQYNLTIQRELSRNMVLQVAYVGTQGHRLLATRDLNFSNPQTCLDLITLQGSCGQFGEDTLFFLDSTTVIPPGFTFHLPYGTPRTITNSSGSPMTLSQLGAPNGLTFVGLRPFSSPQCDPYTGTGCPADGTPVFSSIFAQDTVANSNYNSLQVSLERRLSKGLQFLAAYTWSKSIDNASTFEEIQNPIDPRASRSLSLFDARHRFVISYVWELPIPKYAGGKGKILNGWQISGITSFQSGFPIRILSNNDQELMNSFDFNLPGRPDLVAPFQVLDPKSNTGFYFNTSSFADQALGTLGTAPRAICCGPGISNFDIAIHKATAISERVETEFRAEFFNAFNHTQFTNPDGNISDGTYFGRVLHTRDPRQIQFALKLFF